MRARSIARIADNALDTQARKAGKTNAATPMTKAAMTPPMASVEIACQSIAIVSNRLTNLDSSFPRLFRIEACGTVSRRPNLLI